MSLNIEDLIQNSICFGVAFDANVKECKICEVKARCKAASDGTFGRLGALPEKPEKPEATLVAEKDEITYEEPKKGKTQLKPLSERKTTSTKNTKPSVTYSEDMPDLKAMAYEDLEALAKERGLNLEDFEKYSNNNIKRMRMTMAIKKTYEA